MEEPCDNCIVISCMEVEHTRRNKKQFPQRAQCQECGAWWELRGVETIKFILHKYPKDSEPHWHRATWFFFHQSYVPMECAQRRCKAQAHHKVAKSGKRKYKCNKHAGVCIIA